MCVTHATHIAPNDDLPIDALSRSLRGRRHAKHDAAAHASKAVVVEQYRPVACPVGAVSVPEAAWQCDRPSRTAVELSKKLSLSPVRVSGQALGCVFVHSLHCLQTILQTQIFHALPGISACAAQPQATTMCAPPHGERPENDLGGKGGELGT